MVPKMKLYQNPEGLDSVAANPRVASKPAKVLASLAKLTLLGSLRLLQRFGDHQRAALALPQPLNSPIAIKLESPKPKKKQLSLAMKSKFALPMWGKAKLTLNSICKLSLEPLNNTTPLT